MEILVALLAVLVLIDLVLSFGVIRRLREHETKLADHGSGGPIWQAGVRPGMSIPDFATESGTVTEKWLDGSTSLVAFHSEGCTSCEQDLPALRERLNSGGDQQALVVIVRFPGHDDSEKVDVNFEGATVLEEPYGGPIQSAFQVNGYPSYYLVSPDRVVHAAEMRVGKLPAPTSA